MCVKYVNMGVCFKYIRMEVCVLIYVSVEAICVRYVRKRNCGLGSTSGNVCMDGCTCVFVKYVSMYICEEWYLGNTCDKYFFFCEADRVLSILAWIYV